MRINYQKNYESPDNKLFMMKEKQSKKRHLTFS